MSRAERREATRRIFRSEATYSCPKCESKDLYLEAFVMTRVGRKDQINMYNPAQVGRINWQADSYMECGSCDHKGKVYEFIEEMRK